MAYKRSRLRTRTFPSPRAVLERSGNRAIEIGKHYLNMSTSHTPRQNHLLAALPAADYERLRPHLELVPLPLGWAVYEAGAQQGYVYFPTTCIVSLLYVMEDGASAEIAVTGNDGLVGIALFMGGETTPSRAVVQSAGYAYRLKVAALKREFEHGGALFAPYVR